MANKDLRTQCKYGRNCFQTNSFHHKKYKHDFEDETIGKRNEAMFSDESTEPPTKVRKTVADYFGVTKKAHTRNELGKDSLTTMANTSSKNGHDSVSDSEHTKLKYKILPTDVTECSDDQQKALADLYKMEFPSDFFLFWLFCKKCNPEKPREALKSLLGLELVGPFEALENPKQELGNVLTRWRYFFDPPEFQTIIRGDDKTQFHLGYYRDDPSSPPSFVASNSAATSEKERAVLRPTGDNMFAAIRVVVEEALECEGVSPQKRRSLAEVGQSVECWAEQYGLSVDRESEAMSRRRRNEVVCKMFHTAGIVVPVSGQDVGYREVPETAGKLKKMLRLIDLADSTEERVVAFGPLEELVTLVQFANDEGDYGMALELGLNLFSFGSKYLHKTILRLLPQAYELLGRALYGEIIAVHLESRTASVPVP